MSKVRNREQRKIIDDKNMAQEALQKLKSNIKIVLK